VTSSLKQVFKVSMIALCDHMSQHLEITLGRDLMRIDCGLIVASLLSDGWQLMAGVCLS